MSRFKQIALKRLRKIRRDEAARDKAYHRLPEYIVRAYTEQEGWQFAMDPAAGRDRQAQADNAMFARALLEQAGTARPHKEVKVYRGPGYPIDPEREARRQGPQFLPFFSAWNPL